jgi:hypothetical protein
VTSMHRRSSFIFVFSDAIQFRIYRTAGPFRCRYYYFDIGKPDKDASLCFRTILNCSFYSHLFGQDSPNSNDSIYGTPRGYLSASSSPGQGYPKMAGTCEICFERQAMWVAVPCGHKNMCSFCKGNLHQDTAQCFVCNGYVERWIALH